MDSGINPFRFLKPVAVITNSTVEAIKTDLLSHLTHALGLAKGPVIHFNSQDGNLTKLIYFELLKNENRRLIAVDDTYALYPDQTISTFPSVSELKNYYADTEELSDSIMLFYINPLDMEKSLESIIEAHQKEYKLLHPKCMIIALASSIGQGAQYGTVMSKFPEGRSRFSTGVYNVGKEVQEAYLKLLSEEFGFDPSKVEIVNE